MSGGGASKCLCVGRRGLRRASGTRHEIMARCRCAILFAWLGHCPAPLGRGAAERIGALAPVVVRTVDLVWLPRSLLSGLFSSRLPVGTYDGHAIHDCSEHHGA